MFFGAEEFPCPELSSRRSQRKTKKIDRDQHAHLYPKTSKPKGRKIHASHTRFDSVSASLCPRLTAITSVKDEQQLLAQMAKAFQEQSDRLFELLKIKL